MSTSGAYAIEQRGEILTNTISSTERAAKVNWLVTECGIPIFGATTDETIEYWWKDLSSHRNAQCIAITIERKTP